MMKNQKQKNCLAQIHEYSQGRQGDAYQKEHHIISYHIMIAS